MARYIMGREASPPPSPESALRILRWGIALALFVGAVFFIWRVRAMFLPFAFGTVIAYLFLPLVSQLEGRSVPRSAAILIVYAGVGLLLYALSITFVPGVIEQLEAMFAALPDRMEQLQRWTQQLLQPIKSLNVPVTIDATIEELLARAEKTIQAYAVRAAEVIPGLFVSLGAVILAPVLAFYMLRDYEALRKSALRWLPKYQRAVWLRLGRELSGVLSNYVRGQLIVGAVVGTLSGVVFSVFGVPFPLLLGILSGLFNVVPYFGAVLAAIPGVALALSQSIWTAVWVIVGLVVVNQLEASILTPRLVGDRVGLHPLVVVFVLLAGGELMGFVGLLISVPLAAIVWVLAKHLLFPLFGLFREA